MHQPRRAKKSSENSSLTVEQGVLMAILFLFLAIGVEAAQPAWWTATGGPLNSNPSNDYQAANQGQLKQFTQKAVFYLDTNLPGGAGPTLDNLVANWSTYYATNHYSATNPAPQDFQVVNVGQAKYIGNLVWAQLVAAGYTNAVPAWATMNTNTDYMVANVGQIKTLFNFDLTTDSDTNGLPDWWEIAYFGATGASTGYTTNSSPDGNGLTLAQDYAQGNNPTNYYSQGGTIIVPTISIVSGNYQTNTPGAFTAQPLVVQVVNSSGGAALTNAPVTFTVTAGGGGVNVGLDSATTPLPVTTDSSGHAQVYYQNASGTSATNTVVAATGGQLVTFTEQNSNNDGTFDAPDNITGYAASPTEIDLKWVNHATSATSIIIQKSTDDVNWTTVTTLSDPTTTSYAVTGLTVGQAYYFKIYGHK